MAKLGRRLPHQPSPNRRVKGAFGVAEDTSDASIACRQIGPIKIKGEIKDGERVFDERRSLVFKTLQLSYCGKLVTVGVRRLAVVG